MTHRFSLLRAIAALFLIAVGVVSVPAPAEAEWPTIDFSNLVQNTIIAGATKALGDSYSIKEFGLDTIAWAVAKAAIASMTKSMVNWINSGFNGSPAFVTNLQVYLGNVNYSTANTFTNQLSTNAAIKSPFQSQVASLLQLNFLKSSAGNGFFLSNPYTLNQVSSNDVGFVNGTTDFTSGGGWNAWYALTTQPANNVYGAYNLAQNELTNRLSSAQSNSLTQLGWGQGFLSWCGENSGDTSALTNQSLQSQTATLDNNLPQINADGTVSSGSNNQSTVTSKAVNTSAPSAQVSNCLRSDGTVGTIQTPGSVIQAQINKTLGLSGDQLVSADEFNEVIGALIGQLVNQVVGPTGLLGTGSVSSGGNGYIDQATSQSSSATTNATVGASQTMSNAISDQLAQVTQYQTDWQTIGNEAGAANTALQNCVASPAGAATAVASTTAAATAGGQKAASAISALNTMRNEVTAAGSDADAFSKAANDYQTLTQSSAIPSATDIANIHAQAQDDTVATSTAFANRTLYGQMKTIVDQCALPLGI
jgi:hypothetical protein